MAGKACDFAVADGVVLRGDSFGDEGAPNVVMLPGGGQSRSAWRRTAILLADAGFHAITLDLRGQGESDWAPDGFYGYEAYTADIAAVVDRLGGPAALVGSSLGGMAALAAAGHLADRASALVLADVTPRQSGAGGRRIRALMHGSIPGFADIDEAGRAIAAIMDTPPRASNEGLREHLRLHDGRWHWRWDARVIEDRFVDTPEVIAYLEAIARSLDIPVLLIHAEHSNVITRDDVRHFGTLVRRIEHRLLPGAQHMVTGDSNHAYGEMIAEFLAPLKGSHHHAD